MLDVKDRLIKQLRDVRVVQPVDHLLAATLTNHQPEMPQLAQLVGHRGGLHRDTLGELPDRARPSAEAARIHTRLGVASTCIVSATIRAVSVLRYARSTSWPWLTDT